MKTITRKLRRKQAKLTINKMNRVIQRASKRPADDWNAQALLDTATALKKEAAHVIHA